MSEPLTSERFDAFEKKLDQRFDSIDQRFDATDKRLDGIDQRFEASDQGFEHFVDAYTENHAEIIKRLDRLETLLAMEQRVEVIERRTIRLAELAGHPELATATF